jgi:hypothetical protein
MSWMLKKFHCINSKLLTKGLVASVIFFVNWGPPHSQTLRIFMCSVFFALIYKSLYLDMCQINMKGPVKITLPPKWFFWSGITLLSSSVMNVDIKSLVIVLIILHHEKIIIIKYRYMYCWILLKNMSYKEINLKYTGHFTHETKRVWPLYFKHSHY